MKENGALRVVIAEDQASVRDGLVALLSTLPDVEVIGAAADGESALLLVERERPDAILMDLHMPGMGGVEATRQLTRTRPEIPIVVLSTFGDDESVLAALHAGARSFLTKDAARSDIARALHAAASNHTTLAAVAQRALLTAAFRAANDPLPTPPPESSDGLTEREAEVLGLIATGLSNRDIAKRLFIGNATVKTHINRIFAKLGVTNRSGAIARFRAHQL